MVSIYFMLVLGKLNQLSHILSCKNGNKGSWYESPNKSFKTNDYL